MQHFCRQKQGTDMPRRLICSWALACSCLFVACSERRTAETDGALPAPDAVADSELAEAGGPASELAAAEQRSDDIPLPPPPLFPRGLITHAPAVTPGYVLFNPLLSDTTYLVNNDGQVVHTWKTTYAPGGGMYFLPDGHLLRSARDPRMKKFNSGGTGGILQKLDWDGEVVWEWQLSDDTRVLHHDIEPLPNGNLLLLAWEEKSAEEAQHAGRRLDQTPEQGLWPDWLLEIEPVLPRGANVVWEWHSWDHLIQHHDPEAANYGDPAAHPGRIDINAGANAAAMSPEKLAQLQALGYVGDDAEPDDLESDFLHTNAVAYHPRLDQIALSIPELGEVWIIDHGTTTAEARGARGDLLYRWGNPAAYGRGGAGDQRFFYQHDVRWIPDGWKGAGNLTIFNNGRERPEGPWSSIDERTLPLGPDGRYALPDRGPFGPTALAWQFVSAEPTDVFSPFISGASRQANGNTLICSGTGGRFLEVTREGEIVWEYRSPFSGDVKNEDGSPPQPGLDANPYAIFRATRIPKNHPALAARQLVPLDPQPAWFEGKAQTVMTQEVDE